MTEFGLALWLSVAPAATPSPAPPPALTGVVLAPDGKPLEKALVLVGRGISGETLLQARTAADGRFRIEVPDSRPRMLRVEAAGVPPFDLAAARPGPPLTVRLARGGILEGRVSDGRGRPIRGASVSVAEERPALALERGAPLREVSTDATGGFRVEGLPPGGLVVSAAARGFSRATLRAPASGRRAEMVLVPGSSIAGVVSDPAGRPVAGASLRLEHETLPSPPARATSDARGRFEFAGLQAPGPFRLLALAAGLSPVMKVGLTLERQAETRADLVVPLGARVKGRLVDEAGLPLAARVAVVELLGVVPWQDVVQADAASDGRFTFDRLPEGAHVLVATGRGRAPARIPIEVAGTDEVDLGDLVIETGLLLRGRVHDERGRGLAGAHVRVFQSVQGPPRPIEAETNDDGSFLLSGLSQGRTGLWIQASGFARVTMAAEAGREDVDVTLAAAGSIAGSVVDEADRPVGSFQVTGERTDDPIGIHEDVSTGDGRFRIEDVAPGRWVVQIGAPERSRSTPSAVTVEAERVTDVGKVRLTAGLVLRGTVSDATGAPVAGASIVIQSAAGYEARRMGDPEAPIPLPAASQTGTDGSFEARGLSPGSYRAIASHPDFVTGDSAPVELEAGRPSQEARVVLGRGGRLEGVVRRRAGPLAGARIDVAPIGGYASTRVSTMTDADGAFVFERVRPGDAYLLLTLPAPDPRSRSSVTSSVSVREGETTRADLELREVVVRGRTLRGGEPVEGVQVRLSPRASGSGTPGLLLVQQVRSRADGSFELVAAEPGSYGLVVREGSRQPEPTLVEVPDAETFTLDVELGPRGVPLSGTVVEAETGAAIADAGVRASPRPPLLEGARGGQGRSGEDGRFSLDVDPGRYWLSADSRQRRTARPMEIEVGESGLSGVRLALDRGRLLRGRVVDSRGVGVGGLELLGESYHARTQADGSFELSAPEGPFTLCVPSLDGRFAIRAVDPADEDIELRLQRGGHVALLVRDVAGQPAVGVHVAFGGLDGAPLDCPDLGPTTDSSGRHELAVPAGTVTLQAWARDGTTATAEVTVPEGTTVPLEMRLQSREAR
jgi:protocatechuate 3,4-dioxygenase beta subunit